LEYAHFFHPKLSNEKLSLLQTFSYMGHIIANLVNSSTYIYEIKKDYSEGGRLVFSSQLHSAGLQKQATITMTLLVGKKIV